MKNILKLYDKALKKYGSQRKAARALGIPRTTLQEMLKRATQPQFKTQAPPKPIVVKPSRRGTKRFILSSAQDQTLVHEQFLINLEAYAQHVGATIHIAGFTYNKRLFEDNRPETSWFHPRVVPYLGNRQMELGDSLVWCAEMNTLPTATTPLSGFESYTRGKSGIFPHAKVQLVSVPTLKGAGPKMIATTGAVTLPNYVQKRAGIKAHFHHRVSAVLVEIDSDGDWFFRHLHAEEDGSFQDLTHYVKDGQVTDGHHVEAIVWGDLHTEEADPDVLRGAFGIKSDGSCVHGECMLDWLRPRYQFLHDITDFRPRNHHSIRDPHFRLQMHYENRESIEGELDKIVRLVTNISRRGCKLVVVESNHDLALKRWLKETDWRDDPVNAEFWLRAQLAYLESLKSPSRNEFSPLEWALHRKGLHHDIEFLRQDDSFLLKEIEFGMHGHLGVNGAKGSPRQFTKVGPKCFTAHTHSAGIHDGVYTVGTSSKLALGYNHGPSSWSHTHGLLYPNGKRTLIVMRGPKWCAE